MKSLFLVALLASVVSGSLVGVFQSHGHAREIAELKLEQSGRDLNQVTEALQDSNRFQKGISDALGTAIILGRQNADAAASLQTSVAGVQSIVKRLPGDFAGLPEKLNGATREAAAQYALTCTAVFQAVAASAGRVGKDAAGVASKADGHAADAATLSAGWPVNGSSSRE